VTNVVTAAPTVVPTRLRIAAEEGVLLVKQREGLPARYDAKSGMFCRTESDRPFGSSHSS
jgi:hypothetical protein